MRRFEVTASTLGHANASHATLSKPYRWRGNPDWEPGHPAYRETTPAPFTAGGAAIREIRAGRIASFGDALRDLGHPDAATAPLAAVIEAGTRVGVGERTAKRYRAALEKQQRGDAS